MKTLRMIGRGASDTLEHLLPYTLLSLAWWLCCLLVIPAPAATVALAAMTDPRRAVDRPDWRDAVAAGRAAFRTGWGIALAIAPIAAILFINLSYYGERTSRWGLLIPLWGLLFILTLAVALQSFAAAGLTAAGPWRAIKQGAFLTLVRPGRSLALVAITVLLVAIGGALVVPLVMFIPALVASITGRIVLAGLDLPVPDPFAPTEERLAEERRRAVSSRFGP